MDYSLLVGVHTGELAGGIIPEPEIYHSKKFQNFGGILSATSKATYFIGIIDIFQQYTAGKKSAFEDEIAEACNKRWGQGNTDV